MKNDDYFGEPVIEAARLCAVCEAGADFGGGHRAVDGRSANSARVSIVG